MLFQLTLLKALLLLRCCIGYNIYSTQRLQHNASLPSITFRRRKESKKLWICPPISKALEEGIIHYDASNREWDGTTYSFDTWNKDQTLATAMQNSVNWYFQNLDIQLGYQKLYSYYKKISYGNCDLTAGINYYWAESSLKISPVEQVMLLSNLLENKWAFEEENVQAIKNSLFISDTAIGRLYGKTGTGVVNGQSSNGWFIGFLERGKRVYCFATNLQNADNATGSNASEITVEILNSITI